MDVSNFGVDKEGKTCLFDFDCVGLLPESFAIYTMSSKRESFIPEVARHLGWGSSSNVFSRSRIRGILWTLADPNLEERVQHRVLIYIFAISQLYLVSEPQLIVEYERVINLER